MRILFYINALNGGGAERVMTQLANRFAEDSENSVMLVTSYRAEGEYPLSEKVIRASIEDEEIRQSKLRRNLSRIKALRAYCKTFCPDIAVSFMQEPNFRLLLASMGLPMKKVVSVRNEPNREYPGILGSFVGRVMMPLFADLCVFQTQEAQSWFPKKLQKKSCVIKNEVSDVFFKTTRSGKNSYWIALGRLTPQKNYPMLLNSFKRVLSHYPDERLHIYGIGPLEKDIREQIKKLKLESNVSLCGQTDDVACALADAKGFLMSSDYEGMPNALMEALAVGLPCVVTDCPCGGPRELIRDKYNGILSPVGEEACFSANILYLLDNPSVASMISRNARRSASSYNSKKIFQIWKRSFEDICE